MRYQLRHAPVVLNQSIPAIRTSPNPHGNFFRKTRHSTAYHLSEKGQVALRPLDNLTGHAGLTLRHRAQRPRLLLQVTAHSFL